MSDNKRYWDLFVNRDDLYAVQQQDGLYKSIKLKLTPDILFGKETIGLYQLNLDNKVKWAVLDIDIKKNISKDDPNFEIAKWEPLLKQQVTEASNRLKAQNTPHYIESSGFRGYHIWIFFEEPTPANVVKPWMHHVFDDMPKVSEHFEWELFPKQEQLTGKLEGSLVKAPFQTHLKSGKATYFVDENFNPLKGFPDVKTCKLDPVAVKAATEKTKHAPKSFNSSNAAVQTITKYPVPDNIGKMLANCQQLNVIVSKAENINHLDNEERVILANLGRFFGKPGVTWVHAVLSHCRDYNTTTTDYHISMLSGNPVYCDTIEKARKNTLCKNCKNRNSTPISFGYTHIPQHYYESKKLIVKLPEIIEKLGLKYTDKANSYAVKFNNHLYFMNKNSGKWLKEFNIIDFIRFVKPDDWELFLHDNFPDINANKFGLELTGKLITEIFPFKGSVYTFSNFLSERDAEVEQILTDDSSYNIIAFTGGGKTQAVIKKIQDKKLKAIFLTPYESTARQLESKYKVSSVYGTVSIDTVRDYVKNSSLISSTYDGLRKILETQLVPEDYILLIDEAHNLITHSGFRSRALKVIFDNLNTFKKVINLTGTPEGVINNDYKNVKFLKQNQASLISDYTIIVSEEKSPLGCVDHIINNPPGRGKVVVFKNSIKALQTICDALIERGVEKRRIKVLHANEKESAVFESITDNETIPPEVKYVLTTSVISDGVNIVNQNIEAVYLLDVDNLLLLRQFVARFRKGVKNIYDIIPAAKDSTNQKKWFDFPVELKRVIALYEKIAEEKTRFLTECGLVKSAAQVEMLKSAIGNAIREVDFLRISDESEEVIVDHPTLTLDLLETFHSTALIDPQKRKEYLDHFLNVNCKSIAMHKVKTDITVSKERVRAKAEKDKSALVKLIKKDTKKVVTTFLQKINPSLFSQIKNSIGEIYDPSVASQEFYDKYKKILKLKESQRLIEQYMQFYKFGFPHEFIMELLEKKDNEIGEFLLDYYTLLTLEMVQNHSAILKYNKKSLQVFNYAVFKFLYDYFPVKKEFDYDTVLNDVNRHLLSEKITGKKLERTKLQEIVNRMIEKTRVPKRVGTKVKSVGWKFSHFKTIKDIVDPARVPIIQESFNKYLLKKADFMRTGLFSESLRSGSGSDAAVWKNVNEFRKMCSELANENE